MKILILTRFYLNGQTSHVFSLCQELVRQKHEPYLAIEGLAHPEYALWLRKNKIPFTTRTEFKSLSRTIASQNFTLIHTHSAHTLKTALDLGQHYNIPVIATCHYLDFQPIELLAKATKIITISKEMYDFFDHLKNKTVIIENGIDTRNYKPKPKKLYKSTPRPPKALIATRMTGIKEPGYINLVKILQKYNWSIKSVGNWRPFQLDIEHSSWQLDLSNIIPQADLVIGVGRTIRKAMASGSVAMVLGNYFDGIVTPENVAVLRDYNFSGRTLKQKPLEPILTKEISMLTSKTLGFLRNFGYQYGSQHFSQATITSETVKLYYSVLE